MRARDFFPQAFFAILISQASLAADIAGARDPAGFLRFKGSEIVYSTSRSYDQYTLARGNGTPSAGFEKIDSLEGAASRTFYRVPAGHTSLELMSNYKQMLAKAGMSVLFETPCTGIAWEGYFYGKFYNQLGSTGTDPFRGGVGRASNCYVSAKGERAGKAVSVAVLIGEMPSAYNWSAPGAAAVTFKAGEILVAVDVIVGEPLQNTMVAVKSSDLAQAIATTGSVSVYGILFDVDKTDLKPQSTATLSEVAKLLQADPKLKLEIAGHTDDTGTPAHNRTLSQGRSEAVVAALVKTHGIAAGRLAAKGYGDTKPVASNNNEEGRAKNRRVELKKI